MHLLRALSAVVILLAGASGCGDDTSDSKKAQGPAEFAFKDADQRLIPLLGQDIRDARAGMVEVLGAINAAADLEGIESATRPGLTKLTASSRRIVERGSSLTNDALRRSALTLGRIFRPAAASIRTMINAYAEGRRGDGRAALAKLRERLGSVQSEIARLEQDLKNDLAPSEYDAVLEVVSDWTAALE